MKNLILLLTIGLSATTTFAIEREVKCIAADGLELTVPDGRDTYMQRIDLKNDYDVEFLKNLISRHAGQKTTDTGVALNISFNNCVQKDDLSLSCEDQQSFGSAQYGYSMAKDYVTVSTPVAGRLSLKLARDAKGIFQMALSIENKNVKGGVLVINKAFGPLADPTQTSLTPWSPGCLIAPKAR